MVEEAKKCDFCEGYGTVGEYEGELYPMEDIFPTKIIEKTCPVCHGSGEQILKGDLEDMEIL